jgi:putative membrane protein
MMWSFGMMGWLGMAMMLLFWIGVILLAIVLARALFPNERRSSQQVALEILQRRYAAGEISAEEYEQARRALGEEHVRSA